MLYKCAAYIQYAKVIEHADLGFTQCTYRTYTSILFDNDHDAHILLVVTVCNLCLYCGSTHLKVCIYVYIYMFVYIDDSFSLHEILWIGYCVHLEN